MSNKKTNIKLNRINKSFYIRRYKYKPSSVNTVWTVIKADCEMTPDETSAHSDAAVLHGSCRSSMWVPGRNLLLLQLFPAWLPGLALICHKQSNWLKHALVSLLNILSSPLPSTPSLPLSFHFSLCVFIHVIICFTFILSFYVFLFISTSLFFFFILVLHSLSLHMCCLYSYLPHLSPFLLHLLFPPSLSPPGHWQVLQGEWRFLRGEGRLLLQPDLRRRAAELLPGRDAKVRVKQTLNNT